jgi:hypothetical protein
MTPFFRTIFALSACCTFTIGCGGGGDDEVEVWTAEDIKRREVADLPEVDPYLLPVDNRRLHVAPPKNWRLLLSDGNNLLRFALGDDDNSLPRLTVNAAASPVPKLAEIDESSIGKLIQAITQASLASNRKLIEPVRPIFLGDQLFLRHVRLARFNNQTCAIVSLQTVREGRLYTVDLYIPAGPDGTDYATGVKEHQNVAYSVAARLRFGADADTSQPTAPATSPTSENKEDAAPTPPAEAKATDKAD